MEKENNEKLYHAKYKIQILGEIFSLHFMTFFTNNGFERSSYIFGVTDFRNYWLESFFFVRKQLVYMK